MVEQKNCSLQYDAPSEALYPPLEPYVRGFLEVAKGHSLYWEECGNPDGPVIVFLHGGPGAGSFPVHRRFFDPAYWRVILFDQRGCGRSQPTANLETNTTQDIIADIEAIRHARNIERWMPFGGSWGSFLALAYGIAHPNRCTGFILRGIFLATDEELRWFLDDMGRFFPDAHNSFCSALPKDERDDLLPNYYRRLVDPDPKIHLRAAEAWNSYEAACSRLIPSSNRNLTSSLALARIEAHYFLNKMFVPDTYLIDNISYINHLPCSIIQGRYDIICPPWTAQILSNSWQKADLTIINDAGHSAFEPGIKAALLQATERMKQVVN